MKNKKLFKIILIVIAILIIVILGFKFINNKNPKIENIPFVDTKILGNSQDLVSFSVDPGNTVTGVLTVVGSVQGGYFFEGNILVNILDSDKKLLKAGHGNAKGDWMTAEPVGFDAVLDFTGLSKGPAFIEIQNDNPSGLPEHDKSILIPIIIN